MVTVIQPPTPVSAEAAPDLRASALTSSAWTFAGQGASAVLRLGSNLILADLLYPGAFGLMALVHVFIRGLLMFSDVGIGPSIVQSPRGEERRFLDTAWTIQIVRGFVLWILAAVFATYFARFYDKPQLAQMIPVAALGAVISGFNSTTLFTAARRLALGRKTILDLTSQVCGIVTMVAWAWLSPTVWALVAGSLAQQLVLMGLSHVFLPGPRNRPAFERPAAHELIRFGRWIFVSTLLTFLALQVDRLLLGRLVLEDRLGLYAGAFAVAMMPAQAIQVLSESVVFPVFSNFARGKRDAMAGRVARVRRPILLAGMLCSLGVFLLSEPFFTLLYDERYHASGPMARLLALALWVTILLASSERALLALGDSLSMAMSNLLAFACLLVAGWYGFQLADIHGFILGLAGSFLAKLLFVYWRLAGHGIRLLHQDLRFSAVVVGLAGIGVGLVRLADGTLVGVPHAWCQVASGLIVLVPFGLYVTGKIRAGLSLEL